MPLVKTTLKNDHREVILKFVGSGSDTITLESLVVPDDRQTIVGTPAAHIVGIQTTQGDADTFIISRNSVEAFHVHGNFDFQSDGIIQAVANENETFPIAITAGGTGTFILRIRKVTGITGYTGPFHNEPQR